MANWVGFSDEELRRLKQSNDPNPRDARSQVNARPARGRPASGRGRGPTRDRNQQPPINRPQPSTLPPEARLSQKSPPVEQLPQRSTPQSTSPAQPTKPAVSPVTKTNLDNNLSQETQPAETTQGKWEGSEESSKNKKPDDENMGMVLDDKDILIQELHNVEKFQFQQKRIEEQNKKKRELLAVAISERQKKAKQEATRLIRIQKELAQLDHLLSIDVSIIRNKIEESSREYLEAQRRYERAEKEFIESKMDLHTKSTHKDSLTEHLHMVIHQNEVRKARKLTELMEKLSMEEGEDMEDITEELSTASSAFIIGSLQSTEEQRAIMQRKRNMSDSSSPGHQVVGMPVRRSASDEGSSEQHAGSTQGKGGGVTGWISSWILSSPPADNSNKGTKTENDSDDATFKSKNTPGTEEDGSAVVVTQAPVTNTAAAPGGITTGSPTRPPPAGQQGTVPTSSTTVIVTGDSPTVNSTIHTDVSDSPKTTSGVSVTQEKPSLSPSGGPSLGTDTQVQNPVPPPIQSPVPSPDKEAQPPVDHVNIQNGPHEDQSKPVPKDLNDNKVGGGETQGSQAQS